MFIFRNNLHRAFEVLNVIGDGNCFFRCLSVHFTGKEASHLHLRSSLFKHFKANLSKEQYSSLAKTDKDFDGCFEKFIAKKLNDGVISTDTELIVSAHCYKMKINVFTFVNGSFLLSQFSPGFFEKYIAPKKPMLWLKLEKEHFQILKPKLKLQSCISKLTK